MTVRFRSVVLTAAAAVVAAFVVSGCTSGGAPSTAASTATTAARPSTAPPPALTAAPPAPEPRRVRSPASGAPWQWQLAGPLDESVDVPTYDVDLFETEAATVARLRAAGRLVICYVSVGSWEPERPDAAAFPPEVRGRPLVGWPSERWLDIRRLDVLGPLVSARLDLCRAKGFEAVEPDNVDGYANASGFPLTASDQLAFNRFVAGAAHARGLSVGLKNDVEQIPALVDDFDWALNEECARYDECGAYRPFVAAGKAVLHVEYDGDHAAACRAGAAVGGFSSMGKRLHLDAARWPCPP